MNMMDKINNLLNELNDQETFNSFINEYHEFVDEGMPVDCGFSLQSDSFESVNYINKLEEMNKTLKRLNTLLSNMNSFEIDINNLYKFSEIDNTGSSEEFDNDYLAENLVQFKMKITADQISCKTLNNAA